MVKQSAVDDLKARVEALESVNVLRGFGRATTPQAKALRFLIANQRALEELIEKVKWNGRPLHCRVQRIVFLR